MPTIERARVIQAHMGGHIYWDHVYQCYRVMKRDGGGYAKPDRGWARRYRLIEE